MPSEHLLLLIGTNPLPNYVVARYFFTQHDKLKITAIYTKETHDIAKRLEKTLAKRGGEKLIAFRYCGITAPGNADAIREDLQRNLGLEANESVHLNYTGGTKIMSVFTHRVLSSDTVRNRVSNVTFSYLDSHDFKLKFDEGWATDDLRQTITIPIADLLALHDCREKKDEEHAPSVTPPDWSAAKNVIEQFIANGEVLDFVKWKNQKIRGLFYDDKDDLRKPRELSLADLQEDRKDNIRSLTPTPHPFHERAMKLLAAFPQAQAWEFPNGYLLIKDSEKEFKRKKGEFVKGILYLDGLWLEKYVQQVLEDKIAEEEANFRLSPNREVYKGEAQKEFEIDAMIINGYQLCGISMTTALKESLCKNKAFEILHRSQQMGGEEARAVLVTALDEATVLKLAEDLKMDTGGQVPLLILGAEHLPPEKLWAAVKRHLEGKK